MPKCECRPFAVGSESGNRIKLSGVLADADNDFHSFVSLAKLFRAWQIGDLKSFRFIC
jgi:hypothetical protein